MAKKPNVASTTEKADLVNKLWDLLDELDVGCTDEYHGFPVLDNSTIAERIIAKGWTLPVQQWIPVTERKPEDGVKVLVSVKGRDEALIGWYDADWEDWVVEEDLSEKKLMPVTHWQEKPLPAKDDEE